MRRSGNPFDEFQPPTLAEQLRDLARSTTPLPPQIKPGGVFTLGQLLDRPTNEVPKLLDPLLPKQGTAVLAGSSDTGKSSILRQLALAVAMREASFLGFPINAVHHRAICVSTEDGDEAVGPILKMQLRGRAVSEEARDRLRFVFDTENLPERLDQMLTEQPADLIIVDALGDLYEGNMNQSNEVRRFIQKYNNLTVKHGCLVLFMHHTGKRTEEREPSKHNLLGSQGLEAKMRVAFELRADPYSGDIRHLCVLKGNYLPREAKEQSYVLRFDENLLFHNTGERATFGDLVKAPEENSNERELWAEAKALLDAENSFEKTAQLLRPIADTLGVKPPSKSALARRYPKSTPHPTVPPSQTLVNGMVGCGMTTPEDGPGRRPAAFTDEQLCCLFVKGNTATTAQLLEELQEHYPSEPAALFAQLQQQGHIQPSPSGKDCWRIPVLL